MAKIKQPSSQPTLAQEPLASRLAKDRVFLLSFLGVALIWLAFPPLNQFWAAPFGIACWVELIRDKRQWKGKDYRTIWLAGSALWLALLQGIRLAFWALIFGWLALSLYLAVYLPLFFLAESDSRSNDGECQSSWSHPWYGLEWSWFGDTWSPVSRAAFLDIR